MTIRRLVEKYIKNAGRALQQIKLEHDSSEEEAIRKVLDHAERYYRDSIYFAQQRKYDTALCSIAYCEGLIDALKLLNLVEFEWPTRNPEDRSTA